MHEDVAEPAVALHGAAAGRLPRGQLHYGAEEPGKAVPTAARWSGEEWIQQPGTELHECTVYILEKF